MGERSPWFCSKQNWLEIRLPSLLVRPVSIRSQSSAHSIQFIPILQNKQTQLQRQSVENRFEQYPRQSVDEATSGTDYQHESKSLRFIFKQSVALGEHTLCTARRSLAWSRHAFYRVGWWVILNLSWITIIYN